MKKIVCLCFAVMGLALLTGCDQLNVRWIKNNIFDLLGISDKTESQVNDLKQIGTGITMLQFQNGDDKYPESLTQIDAGDIDLSPYVYIGGQFNAYVNQRQGRYSYQSVEIPGSTPVAFVAPEQVKDDEVPVLYADGHVAVVTIPNANGKSKRQIVEYLYETDGSDEVRAVLDYVLRHSPELN